MHELSLCESIAESALWHADGREVRTVHVRVGTLRQVVPETLAFCWQFVVADSLLATAELEIEHVPATLTCADCGKPTTLLEPILRCGGCGGTNVAVTSGEEFLIESIDVAAAAGCRAIEVSR